MFQIKSEKENFYNVNKSNERLKVVIMKHMNVIFAAAVM